MTPIARDDVEQRARERDVNLVEARRQLHHERARALVEVMDNEHLRAVLIYILGRLA